MSKRIPKVFREHPLASSLLQHTTEIPYEMVPKLESSKSIKISNIPHAYGHPLFQSIGRRASPRVSAWAPYSAENSPGVTLCPTMSKKA